MSNVHPNVEKTLHKHLDFEGTEAYKQIRASLSFLITDDEHKKCRVIGITSSIRGEGKSTTAINLSYVLAESGQKVVLVDADMRLPSIEKTLNIKSKTGLSNILGSVDSGTITVLKEPICPKWDVLTSGDIPPNPSELLSSNRFKKLIEILAQSYDYCIVDLPPVNIVSDAIVALPNLDGLALVVREGYTSRNELAECMRRLKTVDAKVFGIIANDVNNNGRGYSYRRRKK